MKTSQGKTKKESDKSWIFMLLLLLGVGFVFLSQNSQEPQKQGQVPPDPEHMKRVDNHLKDMSFNMESDRRQRQIEYYQQMNKLRDTSSQQAFQPDNSFTLESDPNMLQLTQDLDRSQAGHGDDQMTPEEIVQQRLYENDQLRKASEAYRQAYAQQFIENARRGGWEVELGPNFEVLSVKKLKSNRNPSLFNDGEMSGGR